MIREGDPVPDVPGATIPFGGLSEWTLNAHGRLALRAHTDSAGSVGVVALATDAAGELHAIIVPGTAIEVRPGDVRTVEQVELFAVTYSGGSDGRARHLNDRGQAVIAVSFPDEGFSYGALLVASLDGGPSLPGDANGDGVVNVDDLIAVILGWS